MEDREVSDLQEGALSYSCKNQIAMRLTEQAGKGTVHRRRCAWLVRVGTGFGTDGKREPLGTR